MTNTQMEGPNLYSEGLVAGLTQRKVGPRRADRGGHPGPPRAPVPAGSVALTRARGSRKVCTSRFPAVSPGPALPALPRAEAAVWAGHTLRAERGEGRDSAWHRHTSCPPATSPLPPAPPPCFSEQQSVTRHRCPFVVSPLATH